MLIAKWVWHPILLAVAAIGAEVPVCSLLDNFAKFSALGRRLRQNFHEEVFRDFSAKISGFGQKFLQNFQLLFAVF